MCISYNYMNKLYINVYIYTYTTKASLLAGVGFALAINWGQTVDAAPMIFHVELVLGPLLGMII